jgi:RNA polymerase sigma-70 factor (ECF subfamily)
MVANTLEPQQGQAPTGQIIARTAKQSMSDTEARDDHPEWSRLMAAAQDGDGGAYQQLLREITPLLRRIAARRLYSAPAADVEDVVQDVLLSMHSIRHTYAPERPFLPWLMAIQRHRLADWMRRSMRRGANEVAVESLEETFAERAANTKEAFDRKEIHAAVAGLPPAQRRAIELLKLKEMSLKEATRETGMTETALKVATHRGIKTLRTLLGRSR